MNLNKIITVIFLACFAVSCSNEAVQPDSFSRINIQQGLINSLSNSENISNNIIEKNTASRNGADLDLVSEIEIEEQNIVNLIKVEFPEFEYDESLKEDDVTILLDQSTLTQEIDGASLTSVEKQFFKQIMVYNELEDFAQVELLINQFKNDLEENNFTSSELERADFMVTSLKVIFDTYSGDSNGTVGGRTNGWGDILKSALAGAIVGAVKGFVKGCVTGAFLGFNPGSVAAGCMGGMVVGMVQGAVVGAVAGAVRETILDN